MKDTLKALHQVVTCQSTSPVNSQQFLSGTLTPNALLVDIKRGPFRSPLAQKQVKMFLSDQSKTNLHGKGDEKLLNEIIFVLALKAYQRNMVRCSSIMLERAICIQIEFHGVDPVDNSHSSILSSRCGKMKCRRRHFGCLSIILLNTLI